MKQSKYRTIVTITQKVSEIKSCIANNNTAISNSGTIEILLDSILAGIAEEATAIPKLKLVK